jgi:hypothetical protein
MWGGGVALPMAGSVNKPLANANEQKHTKKQIKLSE